MPDYVVVVIITAAVWISVHIEAAPGFSVHVSGFRVTLQRIGSIDGYSR